MHPKLKPNIEKLLNERLFSHSRLQMIEQCLLAYFFRYILKVSEGEAIYLNFGKAVHKAIEQYLQGDDDKTALMEGLKEINFSPINFSEYVKVYSSVQLQVERGKAKQANVETEIHFKLELEDGIFLQGYIDYLERFGTSNVYVMKDWKTNRIMYNALDSYQLALYAHAISQLKNTRYVSGEYVFLRYYKYNRKNHAFTEKDMEQAKRWALINAKKAIHAGTLYKQGVPLSEAFPKTLNDKCSHCPFADLCIISEKEGIEKIL